MRHNTTRCIFLGMGILVISAISCSKSAKRTAPAPMPDGSQAEAGSGGPDVAAVVADAGFLTDAALGSGGAGGLGGKADAAWDGNAGKGDLGQGGAGGAGSRDAGTGTTGGIGGAATGGSRDAGLGAGSVAGAAGAGAAGSAGSSGTSVSSCVPGPSPDPYTSPEVGSTPGISGDPGALCIRPVSPTTCTMLAASPLSTVCRPTVLSNDHEFVIWGAKSDACSTLSSSMANANAQGAVYDTTSGKWTSIETAGAPLWQADSLVLLAGRKLVVLGGTSDSMARHRYDLDTHQWTSNNSADGKNIPIGVETGYMGYTKGLLLGNLILLIQGQNPALQVGLGSSSSDSVNVWLYDPGNDTWKAAAPFPLTGRITPSFAITSGKLVVWGGASADNSQAFNDGAVFDPVANSWTVMPTKGAPAVGQGYRAAADPTSGVVFFVGKGPYDTAGESDEGAVFHMATGTWTAVPASPVRGQQIANTNAFGNRLVVLRYATSTISVYDETSGKWTTLNTTACAAGRVGVAAMPYAIYKNKLLLLLGGTSIAGISLYDLTTGAATDLDGAVAPVARANCSIAWTGDQLVVWGGVFSTRTCYGTTPASCSMSTSNFANGFSLTW